MIPDTGNIEIGGGLPSGSKIIRTNANQVRLAADRIKKKYRKQKPTGVLREKKKKKNPPHKPKKKRKKKTNGEKKEKKKKKKTLPTG